MASFSVDLFTQSFEPIDTQRMRLTPLTYSAEAVGGFAEATVEVAGDLLTCWAALEWLRYYAVIRNGSRTPVWAGIVTGVEVEAGATRIGATLDELRNRILVDYTYDDVEGTPQAAETEWAQDDVSVLRFGTREERVSLADAPQAQAEQKRATWLSQVRLPVASIEPAGGEAGEAGEARATLRCSGLWGTLEWRYYANAAGRIVFDEGDDAEHLLGWALTSTQIGFRSQGIHDLGARLQNLQAGGKVVVSGSSSNNGTLTIAQPPAEDDTQQVVAGTDISFEPNDDVLKPSGGLQVFEAEEMVLVAGSSANNNGYYWVKTTGTVAIEVSSGANTIQSMSAGPAITLTQGHSAGTDEAVTLERPGAAVTLAALGSQIAQSFVVSGSENWAAFEVMVRAKRVGSPADSLRIRLYGNSGGSPGTLLATATVAGTSVPQDTGWVTGAFGTPPTLTAGTTYWIVVDRTGAAAPDACYVVGLNTDPGYGDGALKIWAGSAWAARWEDGDLPFQVWGQAETSAQIDRILRDRGQFFASVTVVDASGLYKRQWREGTRRALAEAEELMATGGALGRRYVASVSPERAAIVGLEPQPAADDPLYSARTGELRQATGGPWEEGVLPAGRWLQVVDGPPLVGLALANLSPFFCERAEYDVQSGRMTPEPRGRRLPWDV